MPTSRRLRIFLSLGGISGPPYAREREWHPSQRFRTLRDGRLELRVHAGGTLEIVRWILGWGGAAEVVRPACLRQLVRAALGSALAGYRRVRLHRTARE